MGSTHRMQRVHWTLLLVSVLAAVATATCDSVPLTAPAGSNIFAQANPTFVIANGGTSVITVLLTEPAATLVPNGTEVFFFTDLGRVDERVKTVDGIARANFVADSRSGKATITIWSGGSAPAPAPAASASPGTGTGSTTTTATGSGSAQVFVSIGSALPERVVLGADPQRITSPRRTTLVANVFDGVGNPVQNVPVVFSMTGGTEETLASGGSPRYTDSNGQAFDTLSTRAVVGSAQKQVTVMATTANGKESNSLIVFID
jgi:hypothetical protein